MSSFLVIIVLFKGYKNVSYNIIFTQNIMLLEGLF